MNKLMSKKSKDKDDKQDKKDKERKKMSETTKPEMSQLDHAMPTDQTINQDQSISEDNHKDNHKQPEASDEKTSYSVTINMTQPEVAQDTLPDNQPETDTTQPPLNNEELIMLRKLMNAMCGCNNNQESTTGVGDERIVYKDKIVEKEVIKYVDKIIEKEVIKKVEVEKILEVEKLPKSVNPMLDIVSIVKKDEELNRQWLEGVTDQGLQLIKLTAILSQWDQIDRLWDKLASRCKNDKRAPTSAEIQLLEKAVETYNLTLNSRQASLSKGALGGSYDYEKQQRGLPTGDKVTAEWLPALVNAAGTVVKKPLVETR
jgi:hypothetical protein